MPGPQPGQPGPDDKAARAAGPPLVLGPNVPIGSQRTLLERTYQMNGLGADGPGVPRPASTASSKSPDFGRTLVGIPASELPKRGLGPMRNREGRAPFEIVRIAAEPPVVAAAGSSDVDTRAAGLDSVPEILAPWYRQTSGSVKVSVVRTSRLRMVLGFLIGLTLAAAISLGAFAFGWIGGDSVPASPVPVIPVVAKPSAARIEPPPAVVPEVAPAPVSVPVFVAAPSSGGAASRAAPPRDESKPQAVPQKRAPRRHSTRQASQRASSAATSAAAANLDPDSPLPPDGM